MNPSIDEIIKQRRIIITCGTGGVGKTTLSAAIAIRAALLGKRAVVVTIDPAKRLANSLGLDQLQDTPTDLTPQIQEAWKKIRTTFPESALQSGLPEPNEMKMGTLAAIIPDTRRTFENFVNDLSPSPQVANKVMNNPIFQIFAREFSGTNEYMALERLYSLYKQDKYDCIILDTPPSRNTLAFLNAPKLLAQFFEEKLIRWLVLPTNKLFSAGMKKALSILERLTGAGFMTHLFDFANALFEVQINFTANLKKITSLLESPSAGFLIVTTPTADTNQEIQHFLKVLKEHQFHYDGAILNRMMGLFDIKTTPIGFESPFAVIRERQNRERQALENLVRQPSSICAKIPELARDVHSVEDLLHVAMALHHSALCSI